MLSQTFRCVHALQLIRRPRANKSVGFALSDMRFCGTPAFCQKDESVRSKLPEIHFDAAPSGSHTPRLYEALQTCGLGPKSVEYKFYHCTDSDGNETADVDASIMLGSTVYSTRVLGCKASNKRLNESWTQAACRVGKHAAAHYFLSCDAFQTALYDYRTAWRAAKAAAAEEAWRKKIELPTMTDLVLNKFVDTGAFQIVSRTISLDALSPAEGASMIGVDVEGFDSDRLDWHRAWLVQLAFYTEQADASNRQGCSLILYVNSDDDMHMFSDWLSERALRGSKFIFFDSPSDLGGIFKSDAEKELPTLQNAYDLKDHGSSLHELVGEHILKMEIRKHDRLSESMAYLPYTKGLTEVQARYAAADAIATLLVGHHFIGNR